MKNSMTMLISCIPTHYGVKLIKMGNMDLCYKELLPRVDPLKAINYFIIYSLCLQFYL